MNATNTNAKGMMMNETKTTMKCESCQCVLDQAEAQAADEIIETGRTLCRACAESLVEANAAMDDN